jgi:Chaperone of endosialidase
MYRNRAVPRAVPAPTVTLRPYDKPRLADYGSVVMLTATGTQGNSETFNPSTNSCSQASNMKACVAPSDVRLKTHLKRIGSMFSNVGLYLYRYNTRMVPHREGWYCGVMAHEVKAVFPLAVVQQDDGYLAVDYGVLNRLLTHEVRTAGA